MTHAKRIELLMDELGADIAVNLKPHIPLDRKQRVIRRTALDIIYEDMDGGVETPEWPMSNARITVLWDRHTRWAAAHRQFLRRCLLGAGVDDADVAHVWAWPYDQQAPPLESQVAAMRPLTIRALEAANARYVLLVGLTSVKMWRRELAMFQVEGSSGVWLNKFIVMPVTNPVSIMRDPYLQGEWRQRVYGFAQMVNEGQEFEQLGRKCVAGTVKKPCGEMVFMYDVDGVPWCTKHYGQGIQRRTLHQGKTAVKTNSQQQETLL